MRKRVACIAALLSVLLCLTFIVFVLETARNTMNERALKDLASMCRLSAATLNHEETTSESRSDMLSSLSGASGAVVWVLAEDASVLYLNEPQFTDSLSARELSGVSQTAAKTFVRQNADTHTDWLYAAHRLNDGAALVLAHSAYSLSEALMDRLVLAILLSLGMGAMVYIAVSVAYDRKQRQVASMAQVVEDFAEGNYDSRLNASDSDSIEQIAQFNMTLNRLRLRVSKQDARNQALGTVLNHMQNGILAVDQDLNVILVTPSAKRLLGITGSPEGMPVKDASKDVHIDSVLTQAMQQRGVYTNEVAARTAMGRGHTPIRLYVSPMLKDGKAVGAVALVEDITELRRLEQVRTDFAANVSHELKTPLTSIKGFVETLQNGAIENPEMAQKFLRIIMLEADRLTRLINDILTVSKLESGADEAPSELVEIDAMVEDVCEMLQIHAADKQVKIHTHLSDQPCYVMANRDRVEQMILNLVENAIKYNVQGGSVTVSTFATAETINMSISDTGIGIAEEHLPRLFERFYRVDKGRSRSMGGTGLGLAIVKHIVKSMGGMIEAHSKLGEGTEFLLSLPRYTPTAQELAPASGDDFDDGFGADEG